MPAREPTNLMRKTAASLFPDSEAEQATFLRSLLSPEERGNAIVWTSPVRDAGLATVDRNCLPDWLPDHIEVLRAGEKPGLTEAFVGGEFYSLDFSSVLTGSALLELESRPTDNWRVMDLCAAPGGKSILASTLLKPSLLLANEVEGKRLGMLRHNLKRCRITHAWTQRKRPEEWIELAPESFSLCLVDAPCSGQSLLAKGKDNPGCFHPSTVKGNARRQLRILEAAAKLVVPGGFLFYSTCTFSKRENEGVIEKFLKGQPGFSPLPVSHLEDLRSPLAGFPSYRIYPHRSQGAGGFVCLLQRDGEIHDLDLCPLPPECLSYPVEVESIEAG